MADGTRGPRSVLRYDIDELLDLQHVCDRSQGQWWTQLLFELGAEVAEELHTMQAPDPEATHLRRRGKNSERRQRSKAKREAQPAISTNAPESVGRGHMSEYDDPHEVESASGWQGSIENKVGRSYVGKGSRKHYYDEESDEVESFQPRAFSVEGEPDFDAGPPQDGWEYLRRVKYEAARCPKVVVAKIDPKKLLSEQTVYMPEIPKIPSCPPELLPSKEWEKDILANFSSLRTALSNIGVRTKATSNRLPSIRNKVAWEVLCFGSSTSMISEDSTEADGVPIQCTDESALKPQEPQILTHAILCEATRKPDGVKIQIACQSATGSQETGHMTTAMPSEDTKGPDGTEAVPSEDTDEVDGVPIKTAGHKAAGFQEAQNETEAMPSKHTQKPDGVTVQTADGTAAQSQEALNATQTMLSDANEPDGVAIKTACQTTADFKETQNVIEPMQSEDTEAPGGITIHTAGWTAAEIQKAQSAAEAKDMSVGSLDPSISGCLTSGYSLEPEVDKVTPLPLTQWHRAQLDYIHDTGSVESNFVIDLTLLSTPVPVHDGLEVSCAETRCGTEGQRSEDGVQVHTDVEAMELPRTVHCTLGHEGIPLVIAEALYSSEQWDSQERPQDESVWGMDSKLQHLTIGEPHEVHGDKGEIMRVSSSYLHPVEHEGDQVTTPSFRDASAYSVGLAEFYESATGIEFQNRELEAANDGVESIGPSNTYLEEVQFPDQLGSPDCMDSRAFYAPNYLDFCVGNNDLSEPLFSPEQPEVADTDMGLMVLPYKYSEPLEFEDVQLTFTESCVGLEIFNSAECLHNETDGSLDELGHNRVFKIDESLEEIFTKVFKLAGVSRLPFIYLLLRLDEVSRAALFRYHVSWLETIDGLPHDRALWLLALAAVLDTPLNAETSAAFRALLRHCAGIRASMQARAEDVYMLNVLITVAGLYFGQAEATLPCQEL